MKINKDRFKETYQEFIQDWDYSATPNIVKVVWMDAHTNKDTSSYIDIIEDDLIQGVTIGYLMHEKEDSIAICGFLFPDKNHDLLEPHNLTAFRDVHIIPKSQIKAIFVLKTDWEASKIYRKIYALYKNNKEVLK
jgi:hypothetical protein